MINGTRAGKFNLQSVTKSLAEGNRVSVTSAKRNRMNLLGTAFSFSGLNNVTEIGHVNAAKVAFPVSISARVRQGLLRA